MRFSELLQDLPAYLSNHLKLTVVSLAAGITLALPLAVLATRRRRVRYPILLTASIIQTVPSLALLALMVPLLDVTGGLGLGLPAFGFYPAVFALVLYSLLPMLRNTVTGILNVDPNLTEAARGVGMTSKQTLWIVELPLAAPVIIAGIRTATVWVVGMATLSTPIGQKSLGNYIFAGLQTRTWSMLMFGVACAAALAIVLDTLIGGLQRAAETRSRRLSYMTGIPLTVIVVLGLLAPSIADHIGTGAETSHVRSSHEDSPSQVTTMRIGAKAFTEQYILASLLERRLRSTGFSTKRIEGLGSNVVFNALRSGDIDAYVDYSGTIWANHLKRTDSAPPWRVNAEISGWLAREHGIRMLGVLGFENAYALAMKRTHADQLGIVTLADLAAQSETLIIGGDLEFFSRPEWKQLRAGYGFRFRERTSFDPTFMYQAVANGQVHVISAFSSDGRIAAYDLKLLDDPRGIIPPYDAVLLLGRRVANDAKVIATLRPLIDSIPIGKMQRANLMVDRTQDKRSPAQAAKWLETTRDEAAHND